MQTAIDITEMVQRYRLVLRRVWNAGIWVDPDLRDWESVYSFRKLQLPLFRALVADPLGIEPETIFGEGFRLAPTAADGISTVLLNQSLPPILGAGVWSVLLGPFNADDTRLTLLDFFDWTPMDYIDLRYYVVLVEACGKHPQAVGHHALVDVAHARVLWTPAEGALETSGLGSSERIKG